MLSGICAACVIDPGERLEPSDGLVHIVALSPDRDATVAATDTPLVVGFDTALDPRRSAFHAAVSLRSGPLRVPIDTRWNPVERTLTATPVDPMRPGLVYTWEVETSLLSAAGDVPVAPMSPVSVRVAQDATLGAPVESLDVRFDQIAPIFEEHCGCHYTGTSPRLTPEGLAARSSAFPSRRFVEPFDPGRSYLVEKMLDTYPDRFGSVMPPPWSDGPELGDDALRRVVEWIEDGALE